MRHVRVPRLALRLPLTLAIVIMLALATGCGNTSQETRLTITASYNVVVLIDGRRSHPVIRPKTFTLHCRPPGGTLPKARLACRLLGQHPRAMLFRITRNDGVDARCFGPIFMPMIEIEGIVRGERVRGGATLCGVQVGFDMWSRTLPAWR